MGNFPHCLPTSYNSEYWASETEKKTLQDRIKQRLFNIPLTHSFLCLFLYKTCPSYNWFVCSILLACQKRAVINLLAINSLHRCCHSTQLWKCNKGPKQGLSNWFYTQYHFVSNEIHSILFSNVRSFLQEVGSINVHSDRWKLISFDMIIRAQPIEWW